MLEQDLGAPLLSSKHCGSLLLPEIKRYSRQGLAARQCAGRAAGGAVLWAAAEVAAADEEHQAPSPDCTVA